MATVLPSPGGGVHGKHRNVLADQGDISAANVGTPNLGALIEQKKKGEQTQVNSRHHDLKKIRQ